MWLSRNFCLKKARYETAHTHSLSLSFVLGVSLSHPPPSLSGVSLHSHSIDTRGYQETEQYFVLLDWGFTIILALELGINMYAKSENRFHPFFSDNWNLFDFFVVFMAIVTKFLSSIPQLKLLRLVRIFRVARLFKRVRSLNRIINALVASLIPVINSFVILLLVTCIWAILGTQLFHKANDVEFGAFGDALFTMFQVVTGDSWASGVARPLFDSYSGVEDGRIDLLVVGFFVSYVIAAQLVLINIVVAVLLDEFISSVTAEKEAIARKIWLEAEAESEAARVTGVLDPLTEDLTQFNDDNDLTAKIHDTYLMLDENMSGGLDFHEFQEGVATEALSQIVHVRSGLRAHRSHEDVGCEAMFLNACCLSISALGVKKLPTALPIHLIKDDFDLITNGGELCNQVAHLAQ